MATSQKHQQPKTNSRFLALPLEIRYLIYTFTLPGEHLPVNLCSTSRKTQRPKPTSILSALFQQTLDSSVLIRTNGIHLLQVCQRIKAEVLPLLQKVKARFHCEKCYVTFIRHVITCTIKPRSGSGSGSSSGSQWLQHVEIELHMSQFGTVRRSSRQMRDPVDRVAGQALSDMRRVTWDCYGRLDLMGRETWKVADMFCDESGDEEKGGRLREWTSEMDRPFRVVPLHYSRDEINGPMYLVEGSFDTNQRIEVDY